MRRFSLITGGSKGLGAHLVRRFWLDGYSLVVVARNVADIRSVLDQLPERGEQIAIPIECDLADGAQVDALVDSVQASIPYLNVLLNNAAIQGPIGPLVGNDLAAWKQALQVNLLAPVTLCRGMIPLMKRLGGGSIINLSGGGATGPRVNFSAYASAKAGLVRFSETIAEELKSDGIRVNCISPGAMKTAMLKEILAKAETAGGREVSLAREVFENGGASMDRVADLALFLGSDVSNGISGKLVSVVWDNWEEWVNHLNIISNSDLYTLRRIVGRDRGLVWGDK